MMRKRFHRKRNGESCDGCDSLMRNKQIDLDLRFGENKDSVSPPSREWSIESLEERQKEKKEAVRLILSDVRLVLSRECLAPCFHRN